jgi:tetratricopeptide (TPR) repeat protein
MKVFIIAVIVLGTQLCISQETVDIEKVILVEKEDIQSAEDETDINQLLASRNHFISLLSSNQHKEVIHYYIGYIDFLLSDNYLLKKDKKNAKKYIYDGIEKLEKAVDLKDDFADGHALLSFMYVNKAAVNRLSAISSLKKGFLIIDKALKLDPKNPRVLLYASIINYNLPKIFGANKEEGFKYIQESIEYFKTFKSPKPVYPDHGLIRAYTHLGNIHMGRGDLDEAQKCFKKVLEMRPGNKYVKNVLMKQLKEKQRE